MQYVDRNRLFFEKMQLLLLNLSDGDEDALILTTYAARFNIQRVTGYYSSSVLERRLLDLARTMDLPTAETAPEGDLHVLTLAPENGGGHTQIVMDWMSCFSCQGPQDVALISQGREPVPPRLRILAEESGGQIHQAFADGGLAATVNWLRSLALARRRVVLSHHMFDPLPVVAFGLEELERPVFFINHSDHEFSLGRSITDLWVEFRPDLQSVTRQFRGRPKSVVLPLLPAPTNKADKKNSRQEARIELKLPSDGFIILTVAQPYKFAPVDECNFQKFVTDNLGQSDNLYHLIVGPDASDPLWRGQRRWLEAGRLVLAGGVPKNRLGLYLSAADIYVESFPFGGILGTLDAVAAGLPVLSRFVHEYNLADLFEKTGALYSSAADIREALRHLAANQQARHDLAARQATAAFGDDWKSARRAAFKLIEDFPGKHRIVSDWLCRPSLHPREAYRNKLKMNNPGFSSADIFGKMLHWTEFLHSEALRADIRRAWDEFAPV